MAPFSLKPLSFLEQRSHGNRHCRDVHLRNLRGPHFLRRIHGGLMNAWENVVYWTVIAIAFMALVNVWQCIRFLAFLFHLLT